MAEEFQDKNARLFCLFEGNEDSTTFLPTLVTQNISKSNLDVDLQLSLGGIYNKNARVSNVNQQQVLITPFFNEDNFLIRRELCLEEVKIPAIKSRFQRAPENTKSENYIINNTHANQVAGFQSQHQLASSKAWQNANSNISTVFTKGKMKEIVTPLYSSKKPPLIPLYNKKANMESTVPYAQPKAAPVVTSSSRTKGKSIMPRHVHDENPCPTKKAKDFSHEIVPEAAMEILKQMPRVLTDGGKPDGKITKGFLYKYGRNVEVVILCVCHGAFLSPAEFVKHAGGYEVENPRQYIIIRL